MHTIVRNYGDASFLYNRDTRRSVFFEGPLAQLAPLYLDNEFTIPQAFLEQFLPEDRQDVISDSLKIRDAIRQLSAVSDESVIGNSPVSGKNAIQELSDYCRKHWQIASVNLELTYLCNQRCRWCYLHNFDQHGMKRNQLAGIVEELQSIGAVFVLVTGGEIFLRSDTPDILADFEEAGFIVEVKTNGSNLKQDTIEKLVNLRLFDVQVSIYETKTGWSDFTRSIYRFDKITESVRLMVEYGLPVTLSVLVGKHNVDRLAEIHSTLFKLGAEIYYSPYLTTNRHGPGEEISYRLSRQEMDEKFMPFLLDIGGLPPQWQYRNCSHDNTVCFAGRDQIAIDPAGVVYPCLDLRVPLGNLSKESLTEILSHRSSLLHTLKQ